MMDNNFGFPPAPAPGTRTDAEMRMENSSNGGSDIHSIQNNAGNLSDRESTGNAELSGGEGGPGPSSNELEHALLESIFYNEMVMMEENSLFSFPEDPNTNGEVASSVSAASTADVQYSQQQQQHQQQLQQQQVHPSQQLQPQVQIQQQAQAHQPTHLVQPASGHVEIAPAPIQMQVNATPSVQTSNGSAGPIPIQPQPPRAQQTQLQIQQQQHQQHIQIQPRQPQIQQIQPKPAFPITAGNPNLNANGVGNNIHPPQRVQYQPQQAPKGIRHNVQPQKLNGTQVQMPVSVAPSTYSDTSSQMHVMKGNGNGNANANIGSTNGSGPVPAPAPVQTINGQVYYTSAQPRSQPVPYSNMNVTVQSGNPQQHQPINIQPAPANIAPGPQPIAQRQPQPQGHGQHITILPQPASNIPQPLAPNLPRGLPSSHSLQPQPQQSQYISHPQAPPPPQPQPSTQHMQHHPNMQAQQGQPIAPQQHAQHIVRQPNLPPVPNQIQYAQTPMRSTSIASSTQTHYSQISHHPPQHQIIQPAHAPYQVPPQIQQHQQQQHQNIHSQQGPGPVGPSPQTQQQQHPHVPHPQTQPQHHPHAPSPQTQQQHHPHSAVPTPLQQKPPPFQNHAQHVQPVQSLHPPPPARVPPAQQVHATHLVSQFQMLASQLGISLPANVLNELTTAAAISEALPADLGAAIASNPHANDITPGAVAIGSSSAASAAPSQLPSFMKQLQDTAEAAISAVDSRKRKQSDVDALMKAGPVLPARRKKKPTKEDCERRMNQLKSENEMLKRHLNMVKNKTALFEQERKAQEKKMKELVMLSSSSTGDNTLWQKELKSNLEQFSETYSDYGKHRQDELFFHLNQLEKLAAPTTFTKMSLWTLGQNESFFTEPNNHPISGILRKELEITPAQGRKILAERFKIQQLCSNMKEVLQLIADLKALCQKKQKVFSDRMSKCQEILAPEQVTKLLVWIDDNAGVLDDLCPGWGSERIREADQRNALGVSEISSESRFVTDGRDLNDSNDSVEKDDDDDDDDDEDEESPAMEETNE
jgi:hypothetical protein